MALKQKTISNFFVVVDNDTCCCSNQLWHFYLGDSLTVIEFDLSAGTVTRTVLGVNLLAGECVQHAVRAGRVFGALATAELARIDALDALDARASHLDTVSNAAPPPCTSQALTTLCAMSVMSHADLAPAATDADTDASSAPAACAANHVLPARLTSGVDGAGYSLVGCVVAPGFEFGDFALVSRADLEAAFAPAWHRLIRRLTLS